jgi:thioredoxin reductase (NADPH)
MGAEPKPLPGRAPVEEDPLLGSGLFTCASCDGPLYRGRAVAVAGGGDTGAGAALTISRYAARVVLYEREPSLQARGDLVDRLASAANVEVRLGMEVTELHGETALEAVGVSRGGTRTVEPADGLMLAVGIRPRSGLVRGSVELDADDAIAVALDLATSAEGVFAAGDVRAGASYGYPGAVDDGLRAAAGVLRWLELHAGIRS